MPAPPPPGIHVPVPTFFLAPSTPSVPCPLDLETQVKHAIHLASSNVAGLVLLGSTGESVHLTSLERVRLITAVRAGLRDNGYPNFPLLAGTASQSVAETLELLVASKEAGVGWGLVLAPGYFAVAGGVGEEALVEWYTAIADGSPIPILVYHYPAVTNGLVISASAFRRLSKHPNIVGAKFSHGDVSLHTRVALDPEIDHAGFAVFTGLGQQLVSVLQLGCAGGIDGLAAVFPATLVRLYQLGLSTAELLHGAEVDEMRKLQYRVAVMEELVVKCGVRGIKEAAARVMGWEGSGRVRAPLARMGKAEWEEWEGLVEETRIADAKIFVEMVKRGE